MRTVTTHTNVYKFDELSDKAKRNALEHLYDINVDHDWWDGVYEDAKTIGCMIKGFDTGRDLVCKDAHETARLIVENHHVTTCRRCEMTAYVVESPMANETNIFGPAVAQNCDGGKNR